jgi:arabinogalactan endo-1,4-beta-galactosidase
MTFAHVHSRSWGYGSDRARTELDRLHSIGVNWIAISPFAYQKKVDEPFLYGGPGDPTMLQRDLIKVTEDAHARGIKVMLKPHIWSNEFWSGGKWAGDIEMKNDADDAKWWKNYGEYIEANAELAETAKMDGLCIGLELVKMTTAKHTRDWRALIAGVRVKYHGPLAYGANHAGEVEQVEFWDALDAIGVSAYYPLGGEELAPYLSKLSVLAAKWKKPVVFTELGYPAHKGALREPWKQDSSLPLDEGIQARAYEGTFRALAAAPFVKGVFVWKWFSGGADNPHEREPYDPEGKAAEKIIARWYAR